MKLLLLRHPQTLAVAGACYGCSDVAVAPEATREIADSVAAELWDGAFAELLSSPLQRCAGLAQAIAERRPGLAVRLDPRIAEMDFGAWEGRPWSAIARTEFDAWLQDFGDAPAGGHGESTRAFMQRVGAAYDAWREAGQDALWVTHAGVIRAVWLLHAGVRCAERADQWPAQPIDFGERVWIEA